MTGRQRPVLDGPWFCLVEYPGRHLNDFTVFRARDDRWHAIGIIGLGRGKTKIEDSFFHSSGTGLHTRFENHPELLTTNPTGAGLSRQKHAPHILYRGDSLHLFYRRPSGTILHVRGKNPFEWDGLGDEIFTERDARDVCIVPDGGRYLMYYCQSLEVDGVLRSCILARTSPDLEKWSDAITVLVDTAREAKHSLLESPFVIHRPEGWYLFMCTTRLQPAAQVTTVSFSENPLDFGRGEHPWFQEIREAHAAEIVEAEGRTWIVRVAGSRESGQETGRLEIAPLRWEPAATPSR